MAIISLIYILFCKRKSEKKMSNLIQVQYQFIRFQSVEIEKDAINFAHRVVKRLFIACD